MMNEENIRGRSLCRHEIGPFLRQGESELLKWNGRQRDRGREGSNGSLRTKYSMYILEIVRRWQNPQRAPLTLIPSSLFLISLTMWRRMSEVMGYRIALARSPYSHCPPRMIRSRCGSLSAVTDIPVSTWKDLSAPRYDFAVAGLTDDRI